MRHAPRLFEAEKGSLRIWEEPQEGKSYAIGADTASGSRDGDWCAAVVVECETCSQVAELHTKLDPVPFGQQCALLAEHYNEAFLGFEVFPAVHGLAAQHACIDLGYTRLYRESSYDRIEKRVSDKIGWRTDTRTKPLMVDRVRIALLDKYLIRSSTLLREIRGMKFDDSHRVYTETHDDLHDAYAITLMVRDMAYRQGRVEPAPEKPKSWNELHWERFNASTGGGTTEGGAETALYDGR